MEVPNKTLGVLAVERLLTIGPLESLSRKMVKTLLDYKNSK